MIVLALLLSAGCPQGTVDVITTYSTAAGRGAIATGSVDHLVPMERFYVAAVPALDKALAAAPPTRVIQMLVVGAYGSESEYAVYVEGTQAVAVREKAIL